ncbi:hypothetical protein [Pelagibacterium montanilacus]|uniref:hypothetical protein n=1 Tax=Pelagibacterium montanilacus TaxID=2185280 RepID=UPI000F8DCA4E|nr:hypothetical protein [Pelagibacterium montanilacus]
MKIIKAIFRVFVGAVFGIASGLVLSPAIAAFAGEPGDSAWLIWVVVAIAAVLAFFAPTIRRAFGRSFLVLGASTFALPLSMMVLSGRVTNDMMNQAQMGEQGMAAFGGVVAGTMMTGAAAFIGFFLGAIFLIIGLVLSLGGRREVIVVHHGPDQARYTHRSDGLGPAPHVIDAHQAPSIGHARRGPEPSVNRDIEPTL